MARRKGSSSQTTRRVAGVHSTWVRQGDHYVRMVDGKPADDGQRYSRPFGGPGNCTHSLAAPGQPCPWCGVSQ